MQTDCSGKMRDAELKVRVLTGMVICGVIGVVLGAGGGALVHVARSMRKPAPHCAGYKTGIPRSSQK